MQSSKEALRAARQLLKLSAVEGKIDADRVKKIVSGLIEKKPRGYLAIINAYQRQLRLELKKRHAVVESAVALSDELTSSLTADLKKKHGDDITIEFKTDESLVGGMRVSFGSDVWDGSVRSRLDNLSSSLK